MTDKHKENLSINISDWLYERTCSEVRDWIDTAYAEKKEAMTTCDVFRAACEAYMKEVREEKDMK